MFSLLTARKDCCWASGPSIGDSDCARKYFSLIWMAWFDVLQYHDAVNNHKNNQFYFLSFDDINSIVTINIIDLSPCISKVNIVPSGQKNQWAIYALTSGWYTAWNPVNSSLHYILYFIIQSFTCLPGQNIVCINIGSTTIWKEIQRKHSFRTKIIRWSKWLTIICINKIIQNFIINLPFISTNCRIIC